MHILRGQLTAASLMVIKKRSFDAAFKPSVVEDAEKTSNRAGSLAPEVYCHRPRVNAALEQSPLGPAC